MRPCRHRRAEGRSSRAKIAPVRKARLRTLPGPALLPDMVLYSPRKARSIQEVRNRASTRWRGEKSYLDTLHSPSRNALKQHAAHAARRRGLDKCSIDPRSLISAGATCSKLAFSLALTLFCPGNTPAP